MGDVRRVVGRSTVDLAAAAFAELRARYARVVLDIGTGDGKHVLNLARRHSDALVIGLDASADAMRRTAARAAAKPARGGVPNAVFVWAAAEQLPAELTGIDEVHVLMPWGSLLRAFAGPDPDVLSGIAACAPGATFLVTLNLHAWRPPVPEVGDTAEPTPETATAMLTTAGWPVDSAEYLDEAGVAALGTSWTKRLGSSRDALAVLALRGTLP